MSEFDDMCALWRYKTGREEVEVTLFPDGRIAVLDYTDLETYIFEPKPAPKPTPAKRPDRGPGD